MKKLLILLTFIPILGFSQTEDPNFSFHIYISDGFEKDKISLSINSTIILNNVVVTSHPILGITKQHFRAYSSNEKKNLFSLERPDNEERILIKKKKKNQIVLVNYLEKNYLFELNLTKGKYLLITKNIYTNTIQFQQLETEPGFS